MTNLVKLVAYHTWANIRLAEQIKTLPDALTTKEMGGSFPSLRTTLLHMAESDWIWMHRWKGIAYQPAPESWQSENTSSIIQCWAPVLEEMNALVKLRINNPHESVFFITKKGDPVTLPFSDIVLQVTHHGAYHRGQLVNMLRMLNEKPVNTDYLIFCMAVEK